MNPDQIDWSYEAWPSGEPYDWMGLRHERPDDQFDFHLDLGCGKIKKARIGLDLYEAPGVNVVADLDALRTYAVAGPGEDAVIRRAWEHELPHEQLLSNPGLPFPDSSIESMISHHCLEHVGAGFMALMDECWRILKPGAPFRIIVPLFPGTTAVQDPGHVRYFMENTLDAFCGTADNLWSDSFMVAPFKARFEMADKDISPPTPPELRWTVDDAREMRCTLRAVK